MDAFFLFDQDRIFLKKDFDSQKAVAEARRLCNVGRAAFINVYVGDPRTKDIPAAKHLKTVYPVPWAEPKSSPAVDYAVVEERDALRAELKSLQDSFTALANNYDSQRLLVEGLRAEVESHQTVVATHVNTVGGLRAELQLVSDVLVKARQENSNLAQQLEDRGTVSADWGHAIQELGKAGRLAEQRITRIKELLTQTEAVLGGPRIKALIKKAQEI